MLHDTIEDTKVTKEIIEQDFNPTIANLINGVTKMSKLNFGSKQEQNLANTRKIITGITEDVRIIIIKLADRLHNMRTIEYKSEIKQKENSIETLEIFAPLAYYIGAYRIKNELEDLSFSYLEPYIYKDISEKKLIIENDSKIYMNYMKSSINKILNNEEIYNNIKIRTKNVYGIHKKLEIGYKISDIHDLLALKVMVNDISNCYRTLGYVHSLYKPVNSSIKDYICNPKSNMYRSLHTTVFNNNKFVHTQIRTFDMDEVNSFGLTAYWDKEKGNARNIMQKDLKEKYQFFNSLIEIDSLFGDNQQFVRQVKKELFSDNIYVYTMNGDIIELPKGATPIDFAYKLHTDIGNTMVAAKVNGNYVPVGYILKNNDIVNIITNSFISESRENWCDNAITSKAKSKIKKNIKI